MTLKDILEMGTAVVTSLGSAGAIIFGLSGYLGKVWADRGLERQRQEYAQLNLRFTQELDLASRRVQAELDRVGLLHKLRTQSEFEKVCHLWKRVAELRVAFRGLPEFGTTFSDVTVEEQSQARSRASSRFSVCAREAFRLWNEDSIVIPKDIADAAARLIAIAQAENKHALDFPDPLLATDLSKDRARSEFFERRSKNLEAFAVEAVKLEARMRDYLRVDSR